MSIYMYNGRNDTSKGENMSIKFKNIWTNEVKWVTVFNSDYMSREWIDAVNREANALDGWRFAG